MTSVVVGVGSIAALCLFACGSSTQEPVLTSSGGSNSGGSSGASSGGKVQETSGGSSGQVGTSTTTYVKAANTGAGDRYGTGVALSGDGSTLAVWAGEEDSAATGVNADGSDNDQENAGAVYVYVMSDGSWRQEAYLKAKVTGKGDYFGKGVALSADGNTLAFGSYTEDGAAIGVGGDESDRTGVDTGAAYVFTRSAGVWTQQAYLKAANADNDDFFGNSIGLSADGNTLAVGAFGESSSGAADDDSMRSAGAAYVFARSEGEWTQAAYIKPTKPDTGDMFGDALALSADGSTLAVGAYLESSDGVGVNSPGGNGNRPGSGAVYLFTRGAQSWSQQAFLKASNPDADDQFGKVLRLAADGNTLAVSAYQEDGGTSVPGTDNSAEYSGAVYVFARTGADWVQEAYLKAPSPAQASSFGWALALAESGQVLAVGNMGGIGGSVHLFSRRHTSWTSPAPILSPHPESGDMFGFSLALSADGRLLAIGDAGEDSAARGIDGDATDETAENAGAAYVLAY